VEADNSCMISFAPLEDYIETKAKERIQNIVNADRRAARATVAEVSDELRNARERRAPAPGFSPRYIRTYNIRNYTTLRAAARTCLPCSHRLFISGPEACVCEFRGLTLPPLNDPVLYM